MHRRILFTLIACATLLTPMAGAEDVDAWRIEDERHEIAVGDLGQGLRIAQGPADLLAVEGMVVGVDVTMVFEVASLRETLHDPVLAPGGERVVVHALWGDLGILVHRNANGTMFSQAFHWNGQHQIVHPSLAVQDLDNARITVHMPDLVAALVGDGQSLEGDVRVHVSVVPCRSDGVCGDMLVNAWTYGDRLEAAFPVYEDRGACRHIVASCLPDSMIPLLPRDPWPL